MNNPIVPDWLQKEDTATRRFFSQYLNVHSRPENANIVIPISTQKLREMNAILHRIDKNTKNVPQLLKFIHDLFSFGKGESKKIVDDNYSNK